MPAALQRPLGVARVELRGEADVLEDLLGDLEVREERAAHVLGRRQLHQHRDRALGQHREQLLVDAHLHLRRVGGARERVEHLARALAARVGQVEGLAVELGQVGDVVHRLGDEVDRHDVGPAHLGPDERHPLGQPVAQLLDRLEEVVRPVDLVHLAGLRVADDDGRAVDPPRDRALGRGRSSRTRTSCGGRPTGASALRRTCPRGSGP